MYMECCQVAIYLTHSQQNFKKVQFRTDLLYASMGKIKNQNLGKEQKFKTSLLALEAIMQPLFIAYFPLLSPQMLLY